MSNQAHQFAKAEKERLKVVEKVEQDNLVEYDGEEDGLR